ncbi:MAG TPA: zinc ribbon domain-containing protein [Lacunisphaera sp.]
MATYVYETIPRQDGVPARRFEVVQSMKDSPLTRHPDTGEPIRRVISGGYGIMSKPQASSFTGSAAAASCAPGCACHSSSRVPTP